MDLSDGEIRYKTSIDVTDAKIDQKLIRNMVYANLFVMDRYLLGLDQLVQSNRPPAHIIANLERE